MSDTLELVPDGRRTIYFKPYTIDQGPCTIALSANLAGTKFDNDPCQSQCYEC